MNIVRLTLLGVVFSVASCSKETQEARALSPSIVTTGKAIVEDLPIFIDLPGTTTSVLSVDVRARVEGWLLERHFEEGDEVAQGDLLYEIDAEQYTAQLQQAESALLSAEMQYAYAKKEFERNEPLVKNGAVSKQTFDGLTTQFEQAATQVDSARAGVEVAQLNVEYCQVLAPVSGVISKTNVDVGNLVGPSSQSTLTSIVQVNPMYVEFHPPASRLPMIKEAFEQGDPLNIVVTQVQDNSEGQAVGNSQVRDKKQIQGSLVLVDNTIDSSTSTFLARGEFINNTHMLPGQYVEVRLQIQNIENAVMVPTDAIAQQPGGFYVWTITDKNTAQVTPVTLGAVSGKYTHVQSGVDAGKEVIVKGMTSLRAGMPVVTSNATHKNATSTSVGAQSK